MCNVCTLVNCKLSPPAPHTPSSCALPATSYSTRPPHITCSIPFHPLSPIPRTLSATRSPPRLTPRLPTSPTRPSCRSLRIPLALLTPHSTPLQPHPPPMNRSSCTHNAKGKKNVSNNYFQSHPQN